jgi:N utilization substance protein B
MYIKGDYHMKRREAREKVLQTLFQLENTELTIEEAMSHVLDGQNDTFYEKLVRGTTEHLTQIDESLKAKLENWSLNRLPKIERTILRLAVFELLFMQDAPSKVVINEAIELSKTFGDDKSSKFVNGVLSKYAVESSS